MNRLLLLLVPALALAQIPGPQENRTLLPNGWWLSPVGDHIGLGDLPMNCDVSDNQQYLAVTHSGYSKPELILVDLLEHKVVQWIQLKDSWLGIKFAGRTLYVSGGNQNCVYVFTLIGGKLQLGDTITFAPTTHGLGAAGLDVQKNLLAIVFRNDSTLRVYDLKTKTASVKKLDGMPYTCKFLPDGSMLVSLWSSAKVELLRKGVTEAEFGTGEHPTEIAVARGGRYAYVANANDNSVTAMDLKAKKSVASVATSIYPDSPEGSTTNSVTITPDGTRLLAANADNNSLTVIDIVHPAKPVPVGFIPVGWYPTKVMVLRDNTVLVLDGKGQQSLPNPKKQYIAGLLKGTLSYFKMPREEQLVEMTKQVYRNTPYQPAQKTEAAGADVNPIPRKVGAPSPIKYVFYIIKENRTYDQVFGDMPEGNGDSAICIFGENITPNHHALVRDFTLFDNFYVDAEVSADGHNWSTAAYATDYVEKLWPSVYGGRGGEYDFEAGNATVVPHAGYIWDACARANLSYRSYGEYIELDSNQVESPEPFAKGLVDHFDPRYRGWDLSYSDVDRYKEWDRELTQFEQNGGLPRFNILRLPNDHTQGTHRRSLTPRAYVAQNDTALGSFVARLSRSKYWSESAVFVVEDDAQDGPDHVDAHRTVAMAFGPYVKRHFVDHTLYTTSSMLRTMELILGLPPMSQFDAAATPMFRAFTSSVDTAAYHCVPSRYNMSTQNNNGSYGQNLMEKMNFSREDAVPDRIFNEVIWHSVKDTPMPPPRYSVFSISSKPED